MRYIIYGAGGVGGIVGGKLFMSGKEVVLIARGAHLEAIRRDGLRLQHPNPNTTEMLRIPAVSHPSEIEFRDDDVVILTMKSQDTIGALEDLREAAGDLIPVVCAQNGVENERQALRRFRNVYGMLVIMPANYLEPGLVDTTAWPGTGVLDLGRYPEGSDDLAEQIAADVSAAGFVAQADPKILRLKYSKLNQNMVNAIQAIIHPEVDTADILEKARKEAEACFTAAGIEWAPTSEMMGRNAANRSGAPAGIGGGGWRGGSTWQSLMRGVGSSETDYLNGEIVLLGRLHGVPTPANEVLQLYVDRVARSRQEPGTTDVEEVRAEIARREAALSSA
jgi:2-dehydropantoate 2-reductase